METIISREKTVTLLGRPLSKVEEKGFTSYIKIAQERLEDLLCTKLEGELAPGMELLIARCFATIVEEQTDSSRRGIKSKKVEDFSLTYDDKPKTPMELFVEQNSAALDKYSKCQAEIRHGVVV